MTERDGMPAPNDPQTGVPQEQGAEFVDDPRNEPGSQAEPDAEKPDDQP